MRRKGRVLLLLVFMVIALLGLTGNIFNNSPNVTIANTDLSGGDSVEAHPTTDLPRNHILTWTITAGDTLTAIFENCHISQGVMYQILAADESLLALDILRPGNLLTFTLDRETHTLVSMELFLHAGKQILYKRVDDTSFGYEEITIPGDWKQELLKGDIVGSFYLSALRTGLTDQETGNITDIFRDRIRFAHDMRTGDRFQVIRSRQFVDKEFTGQSRIEGVRIFRGARIYSAFLFDDGTYYDYAGKSLTRALRRYPTNGHCKVTSHFSRARCHPISRRIMPHNGVDFAMPPGTPVLSTGDGVVTRVHSHPFAGKYVEIQHGSHYITRYLHLRRILVRRGQSVQRGERIALSGNSGRSTGPHLHYELHINGRPVNPLTADIPMASSVSNKKMEQFKRRVGELVALMEQPSRKIAHHGTNDHSSLVF
jgi:murein DD-endopeptidase